MYRGPFKRVLDDDGHAFPRGERIAVGDKTFRLLQQEPYAGLFETIEPLTPVPLDDATTFDCSRSKHRDPRETKGVDYDRTTAASDSCCGSDGKCC